MRLVSLSYSSLIIILVTVYCSIDKPIPKDTVLLEFINLPSSFMRFHTEKRDNVKPFNVGRDNVNEWTAFDIHAKKALIVRYGRRVADDLLNNIMITADEMLKYIPLLLV
jgi:hypothetical protein